MKRQRKVGARRVRQVAIAAVAGLSTVGAVGSVTASGESPPEELVAAAEEAAREAAGGEELGGDLSIVSVNTGLEGEIVEASFAPFAEATGVDISYQGTADANTIVQTGIEADNPPDIYIAANAGGLSTYLESGSLVALDEIFDTAELEARYPQVLRDAVTRDGHLYGIWNKVDLFMIWYNTATYTGPAEPADWAELDAWAHAEAEAGNTPWCIGVEAGAASGVFGAHFIANTLLRTAGPDAVTQLGSGELPFTASEVADAFRLFGDIATDDTMVAGGATGVLSTRMVDTPLGLFSDPPGCELLPWGNYAAGFVLAAYPDVAPVEDLDFLQWPAVNPEFAGSEVVAGHVVYAFNDTPQVRAFLDYYSSAAAQSLLASSGQWVVANQEVPLDVYPNDLLRRAAEQYLNASDVVLSPVSQLPGPVVLEFYKGVVAYLQDPDSLEDVLQTIENARSGG